MDNTSKYDTTSSSNQTFSYDSTEQAYKLQRTSDGFGSVIANNVSVDTSVEVSVDIKMTQSYNNQPRISLYNGNNGVGGRLAKWNSGNTIALGTITKTGDGNTIGTAKNVSTSWGTYYTIKMTFDGSTVTEELYNGSTLVDSVTGSQSTLGSSNGVGLQCCYTNGSIFYFKNLKVKPL